MNWLRRLAGRFYYRHYGLGELPEDREVDLSLGHPSANLLLEHIKARRWTECESLFLALRPDERYVLLGYCVQQPFPRELFDEWMSDSSSFVAGLFRGTAMTFAAWDVRGGGRGREVSDENQTQFTAMLETAWDNLMAVHKAVPDEVEPLARLIPVAMGLETGADDIREIMARCVNTGVPHLGAALYATEALSEKWLGSAGEALEFAYAHAEEHPRDRAVIACAHAENCLWLAMQDRDNDARQYFSRPDVQRDLRECWGREVDIAGRTDYFRFHALNYYAWCLLGMDEDTMLREALDYMGTGIVPKPWTYATDKPVFFVNTARRHMKLPSI